jgi:methionyl-tRNA formyltransferase
VNIVIVTQRAPMYLPQYLDRMLSLIRGSSHRVDAIVVFPPFFNQSALSFCIDRYHYYGPLDFLRMSAHVARQCVLAKIYGYMPAVGCRSVNNVICKYNVPIVRPQSVNDAEFVQYIQDNNIDAIVSIASPQIFREDILKSVRYGCLNYHTGLLPRYRGRQPLFWALLNDEPMVGISIHLMDEMLDNGPILVQKKIPVAPNETLHSLYLKTISCGPRLLLEALDNLENGDGEYIENNAALATKYSFPTRDDALRFRARGKRFF